MLILIGAKPYGHKGCSAYESENFIFSFLFKHFFYRPYVLASGKIAAFLTGPFWILLLLAGFF